MFDLHQRRMIAVASRSGKQHDTFRFGHCVCLQGFGQHATSFSQVGDGTTRKSIAAAVVGMHHAQPLAELRGDIALDTNYERPLQ
jgi:hypothetical protein